MEDNLKEIKHHKQQELCKTRAAYRQGKNLTAVKVYTVITESQHLFVYGVQKIGLRSELKSLCTKYGQLITIHAVADYKTEIFTECYHVQYDRIQSARIAKRLMDNKSFYGHVLHVCYAPEFETVDETRAKFAQRSTDVLRRINPTDTFVPATTNVYKPKDRKRKYPAIALSEERMANTDPMLVWLDVPKEIDPREPKNNFPGMSKPNKHYEMPKKEYGPFAADFVSNDCGVDVLATPPPIIQSHIIPTQVIQSMEYKYKHVKKKIVFRNKKL